ncbi:uncharacterized protein LOC115634389 [Scaptodrosophila lebanonensis]|uniref:Uncharacterized protein LOC115634389 n=1 Tax=Drosophila lebanonensis TaxID=7225 RepID=A0A6J2UKD3_DROLE|nr:uncharacterized protein LOC115634389 [Scaptodrosophila lebanonensis]
MSANTSSATLPPTADSRRPPLPHELTAEWTVRAQLKFARAGEQVQREYSTDDPLQPVRVVYKWSAPCEDPEEHLDDVSTSSTCKQSTGNSRSELKAGTATGTSFRSVSSSITNPDGGVDSAFGSPQTSRHQRGSRQTPTPTSAGMCGTRCRSSCNITISAVADFLPQNEGLTDIELNVEHEPSLYGTTVPPEQSFPPLGKILALRDAFSQTSDTETKYFEERRRPYEQRRATTEALMSFANKRHAEEANSYVPPYSPSPMTPSSTFRSTSLPRIPTLPKQHMAPGCTPQQQSLLGDQQQQKKPRTVHIDVYCTGSEDDEVQADGEASSSDTDGNEGSRRYDLDSNSTRQTVLDNEQMLLRHKRVSGGALPRRLAHPNRGAQQGATLQPKHSKPSDLNLGHAITKSSTAEEISESKQLLFRKHIGDQRAAKLVNLRQKYMRQPSDDTLSSVYPNSSRSTVPLDATCSSISSAVPSTYAADNVETSWKETDEPEDTTDYALTKSNSFDYENSLDRLRIKQMERQWSRQHSSQQPTPAASPTCAPPVQSPHLQTISEVQSQRDSPFSSSFQRSDTLPSESDAFSDTNVFHAYPGRALHSEASRQLRQHVLPMQEPSTAASSQPAYLHQSSHFPRNRPGFLQFFGPQNQTQRGAAPTSGVGNATLANTSQLSPNYSPHFQRWKSEARDNLSLNASSLSSLEQSSQQLLSVATVVPSSLIRSGSEAPPTTTSAATFNISSISPVPQIPRRFDISRESPCIPSIALSGYTNEHLEKALRFGNVVAVRKPGHHVGPTKNPNCQCESCQRWLAERFYVRGRAFSLGERPVLRRT